MTQNRCRYERQLRFICYACGMQLIPIQTPLLKPGDDLANILQNSAEIQAGDILVISSKAIATVEGTAIDLSKIRPSQEAKQWSAKTGRSPEFTEATLDEMKRLHGKVIGDCPGAILTEVKPEGLRSGTILTANAGMDESNVKKGWAIGWPRDPVASTCKIRRKLQEDVEEKSGKRKEENELLTFLFPLSSFNTYPHSSYRTKPIAIILSDSCCHPRRLGVTAFALVCCGIDPVVSLKGKEDLYAKKMRITTEAVADQLATAANILMGNDAQSVPAVIIREHGIPLTDFEGWVPGIESKEDLFREIL